MSNELTKFLSNDANLPALTDAEMAGALQEAATGVTSDTTGVQYLTFSGKTGVYGLGRDRTEMDPEDYYLLEPKSFIRGWTCWKGNKPVDRHEWSVYSQGKDVAEHELEDHGPYRPNSGEGWQPMLGFGCMDTDDNLETSVKFSSTSQSGRNAIGDMMGEIKKRMMDGEPSMPLIGFDVEEFIAQEKKNFKPVFVVEAWVTREAAAAFAAGDMDIDDLIAGNAPKKKAKAKAKKKGK